MDSLSRDVRYALRSLVSRPSFTVVAVAALALGIGANTAIFSVVYAVLLRPLPFPGANELVIVFDDLPGRQIKNVGMSVHELRDLQERSEIFQEMSAVWPVDANLTGSDRPERIELLAVSPNYFSLLGANPQLGRVLGPEDKAEGFAEAVVISDGLWHRLFAGDPGVLGRKVRADTDLYTIVGVMPRDFRHPGQTLGNDVDMWATAGFAADPFGKPNRNQRILPGAIGRLKSDLTVDQARAKLDSFVAQLTAEFPDSYPAESAWTVRLAPARENLVGDVRTTLFVLLGAVGFVLLICSVNIANLMLARSLARQREMAIRLALGANRRRLVRQLLVESLLLALAGGGIALLVAAWGVDLLLKLVPTSMPRLNEVGINGGVLAFTLLISLVTGVLFGLIPALQASRPNVLSSLKEGGLGSGFGSRHNRLRSTLVVTEFALSLVLMIGAGLMLRSFWRLLEVNPGFSADSVLMARIWLPVPNNPKLDVYRPPEKREAFVREVLRRASAISGVRYAAAGAGGGVPLSPQRNRAPFTIEELPMTSGTEPVIQFTSVSPDYFKVLGASLQSGRFFHEGDGRMSGLVALVDETMATRYWPNQNPIGKRLKFGRRESKSGWIEVIGVVANMKTDGFDAPDEPHVYVPIYQNPNYSMAVYVRTEGDPSIVAESLRREVQAVDPDLPIFGEQTMETIVSAHLAERRFAMTMVTVFGAAALLLAAIGIYGVMSYSVNQRTREIGIRMAVGAESSDIMRWVLRQGLLLTSVGVGLGLVGALVLTRLMRDLLFQVAATDLLTYSGVAVVLAIVALAACLIPARRATKVDPIVALRCE